MSPGNPLAWHLMLRLEDDRVLAPDLASQRALARLVIARGERHGVIVFRAADTHLHVVAGGDRGSAARCAQAIGTSLRQGLRFPVAFQPARIVPVRDQGHARNVVPYVLGQEARHGAPLDPCHEASALPDLLGARVIGRYLAPRLRALLPRTTRADLVRHLGVPELGEQCHPTLLVQATLAAFAAARIGPEARRAAIHAAGERPAPEVAAILGIEPGSVYRVRRGPAEPTAVRAIRQQMALRAALGPVLTATPFGPSVTVSRNVRGTSPQTVTLRGPAAAQQPDRPEKHGVLPWHEWEPTPEL